MTAEEQAIALAQGITRAYSEFIANMDAAVQRFALADPGPDRIEASRELFEAAGTAGDRYVTGLGVAVQRHLIEPDLERIRQDKVRRLLELGRPEVVGDADR